MRYQPFFSAATLLLLAACSGTDVKDTLGLTRDAPDEFRVVTRPPLSVPPQFDLRPPAGPGEHSDPMAADQQAKSLITGKPAEDNTFKLQPANINATPVKTGIPTAKTTPEANFLQKAGAVDADPNVRLAIEKDKAARLPAEEEKSWWDFGLFPEKKEPMVDAKGEADRLKKNKNEGKPVTEGETPDATGGRDKGWLGRILDY